MWILLTPLNRARRLSVSSCSTEEETVRPQVLTGIRSCVVAVVIAGLINLTVMAASSKPLGMIVIADRANVDHAKAAVGADVLSGDALSTDAGGSLRMKIGQSQVYLLSSSDASLTPTES